MSKHKKADENILIELEKKIKHAEENNLPLEEYVLPAINILENSINTFLKNMEQKGELNKPEIAHIEIRQYAAIKNLAEKINLPTQKYDELIKKAQCRIFGEKNWEIFFKN